MPLRRWWDSAETAAGALPMRRRRVDAGEWLQAATDTAAAGGRLLALWAGEGAAPALWVRAALALDAGVLVLELPLPAGEPVYRSLHTLFPAAARMQRAAFDLCGVSSDAEDQRPWLNHGAWGGSGFALRTQSPGGTDVPAVTGYDFVRVDGEGVHEIAVGPVHAGIIEPGHFRFSVVGEKVLRLEERLGYLHKGIERRFTELPLLQGHRLAARVSGDSAVAFAWAYCQALEGMSGCTVPPRAAMLRGVYLELERIANHLGDLGALGNDAGFAFGLAQFSRLKELLLRATEAACGRRYLLDAVVPGGTAADVTGDGAVALAEQLRDIAAEAVTLREIYDEHAGVRDRFTGAGQVSTALARRLGLTGLAGRASGLGFDVRLDFPGAPYDAFAPALAVQEAGDVAARVAVRFDELENSCRLAQEFLSALPAGAHRVDAASPAAGAFGVGLVEGWRGPVLVALDAGPEGRIQRCHPHDPSWHNWPVLEHAIIGNIVPDFPLINKSFNLSYSGCDL